MALTAFLNIALEDGDRFVVPHLPSTINVVGAVYDQNSFLFSDRSRAGGYLRQAGGLNKDADRRHEFIIRADGEVVSHDTNNGPPGNDFNNLRIYPGDTIVVPEKDSEAVCDLWINELVANVLAVCTRRRSDRSHSLRVHGTCFL